MAKTQRTELLPRADAILDAAADLLTRDGQRKLRVDDVAELARVAKGTVYLHWPSREELMLAVGAREAAAMFGSVADAIRTDAAEAALHRYIRRHFLEAMRRPVLRSLFVADGSELAALTRQRRRSGVIESKLIATREYLTALDEHRLLRPGQNLDDVDYGLQAVAYGFFAAEPSPRSAVRHADQLAEVVRRSFEPARAPAADRFAAAAPHAVGAFTKLAADFRRLAYGSAAD